MDRYDAVRDISMIHSVIASINQGDSAATDENALYISETTAKKLEISAERLLNYVMDAVRREDEIHG